MTYLEKLKKKNILIVPLEKYKGAQTKILHKCICGNEWNVKPMSVLIGNKCGCKKGGVGTIISNEKYLEKLKKKNIKVMPLEKYKGVKIKILHKCICGNEWKISPEFVLINVKCGCIKGGPKIKKFNYLEKLLEKNIKIIPLEKYKGAHNKILHKCTCGNEWNVKPNAVLNNSFCGCIDIKNKRDKYNDKETMVYYIKILGLWKIGIALYKGNIKKTLKMRFNKEYDLIEKIIKTEVFKDGAIAFDLEQQILFNNKIFRYKGITLLKSGSTELFIKDISTL